jgi:hypothetical protein
MDEEVKPKTFATKDGVIIAGSGGPGKLHEIIPNEQVDIDEDDYTGVIFQKDIDRVQDKAAIICINCEYVSVAGDWKKPSTPGLKSRHPQHGRCPMCYSAIWDMFDPSIERVAYPQNGSSEDNTEEE